MPRQMTGTDAGHLARTAWSGHPLGCRIGKSEELIARIASAAPLERLGTPDDIAESVAFLAGDGGRWINGQVLYANGGIA
ncbi:NAD(P)-dependent dehydrogenase (short-subunit alcohol dehydrogenase family) [Catenulispora sp. MAP12-49]